MADFKKLADVEVIETPSDVANVLIEEDGVIKKAPKTAVGGAGGGVSSWNDLTDKPFSEEISYCPGGDQISITDWTVQDEYYHFSSEYTTEKNFDMAELGAKYIIKTDSYECPEEELTCCHVEWTSDNGGFFILGSSELAVRAGYVDACDAYGEGQYAVKCTVATENNLQAKYGKIQVACIDLSSLSPTMVEILGPVTTATLPDKFIPDYVPKIKTYANVGQFLSVKSLDDNDYPSEWEAVSLPKAAAIADVTEAPTAEQFNALLAALREAGYMKYSTTDDEYEYDEY